MVSPFMSFATGALDSIGQQIDKYDAAKTAKDLRDEARTQRQEDLEFQRETQLELQKRAGASAVEAARIKHAGDLGSKFNTFKGSGKTPNFEYEKNTNKSVESQNLLTAAQANPEGFKLALNDANTGDRLKARVFEAFSMIRRGQGAFSNEARFGSDYRGELPRNVPFTYIKNVLRMTNSPELLNLAEQWSSDPHSMRDGPAGNNVNSSIIENGEVVDNDTKYANVKAASLAFAKVNLGVADADAKKAMFKSLRDAGTDRITNQIYINAAANPNLMASISASTSPNTQQKTAALAFLQNPENGFTSEDKPNTIDVANFAQFVSIFGRRMAGKHFDGAEPQFKSFAVINKGRIAKELGSVREVASVAATALKVANAMTSAIKISGAGGSVIQEAKVLTMTVPEFIRDAGGVLTSILRDRGYGLNRMMDASGDIVHSFNAPDSAENMKSYKAELQKASINSQKNPNSKKNIQALAAAKLKMLELTFAYQITGILQGGTGGRTISDTDIQRALEMFRSKIGNVTTRLANINFIKGLITSSISKGTIYKILDRTDINADMYASVVSASSLFDSGLTLDNFHAQSGGAVAKAVAESAEKISTSNVDDLINAALTIRDVKERNNYEAEPWRNGIQKVLTSADGNRINEGRIVQNYVVQTNVLQYLRNIQTKHPNSKLERDIKAREEANEKAAIDAPFVFNLITGKVEKAPLRVYVDPTTGKVKVEIYKVSPTVTNNKVPPPVTDNKVPPPVTDNNSVVNADNSTRAVVNAVIKFFTGPQSPEKPSTILNGLRKERDRLLAKTRIDASRQRQIDEINEKIKYLEERGN